MMFYIHRCPYCGKIFRRDLGCETFYNYEDKKDVTIECHRDCGSFVSSPIPDVSYTRYDVPHKFYRYYTGYIEDCVLQILTLDKLPTEEEILNQVIKYLTSKEGGSHDLNEVMTNIDNIKTVIEIIVGQISVKDIFAIPLTEEVENKLIFTHRACFD